MKGCRMPRVVNEEERRRSIADAALALIAKDGLESATFRAIARERGLSLGAIQHLFVDQAQLRQCVVSRFIQQVEDRLVALDEHMAQHSSGCSNQFEAVVSLLFELLPLDEDRRAEARIWEAFAHASITDERIAPFYRRLDSALDRFCVSLVAQMKADSLVDEKLDDRLEGARLHALLDGLTLQLLNDSSKENRSFAETVLRCHMATLVS